MEHGGAHQHHPTSGPDVAVQPRGGRRRSNVRFTVFVVGVLALVVLALWVLSAGS